MVDLLGCEIEETLNKTETYKISAYLYYFYQVLRNKVAIQEINEDDKNTFFYVAAEQALLKNDEVFIRYHLFTINFGPLSQLTREKIEKVAANFHVFYKESERILNNPYNEKLTKFARRQAAPFRVLHQILDKDISSATQTLSDRNILQMEVTAICSNKYKEIAKKLNAAAFRSIVYIFFTKMILVLLIELPLSRLVFGEVHMLSLAVNTLFPPVLMGLIVSFINPPTDDNTKRIFGRIVDIIDKDPSFEGAAVNFTLQDTARRPMLLVIFSLIYATIFLCHTYSHIYWP
ncbi:MAG: hypothetical protein UZ22_OP11002000537 [Microgenomates bacterium OLB23]|nr:MAG: hypothetical protein UZ22_OP11002000537 [Microgenomates bacterium OLB23]